MDFSAIPLPDSWLEFGARLLAILLATVLALWITGRVTNRLDAWARRQGNLAPSEGEKRLRTASNILRYAASLMIVTISAAVLLNEFGINLVPLLAGASFLGLILGLGAQNLVKDYVGGFFLLVENQYAVGDVIEIGNVNGRVERITLRMTQLRDVAGKVHFIPNGDIRLISNLTKEWSRAVLEIGVAYKEDVDRVIALLEDLCEEMGAHDRWGMMLTEPANVMGVQSLGDSAVTIRVALTTLPEMQWDVGREFRRRVKNRFDAEGIEIPFPHRTVYVRDAESFSRADCGAPSTEGAENATP